MSQKTIIITGINGQLSQYLAKYLQENEPNLQIIGTLRHKSARNEKYIFNLDKVIFELMDLSDHVSIENLISKYKPDFFVNTAANAFVAESWKLPMQHLQLNAAGVLCQLEAVRKHSPLTRYVNLGTSEEFADAQYIPQDEKHPILPKSPYACAKAAARYYTRIYRESYGLYCIQPWCFNFESPLRDHKYLPKKVTLGVARINNAIQNKQSFEPIVLGNIYSKRAWQAAQDVSDAIWRILNQERYNKEFENIGIHGTTAPINSVEQQTCDRSNIEIYSKIIKEYVISSEETHSVKTFCELAFKRANLNGYWKGEGLNEKYILDNDTNSQSNILVSVDKEYFRPNDVNLLLGNPTMIKNDLKWEPKYKFEQIINEMVDWDIKNYAKH